MCVEMNNPDAMFHLGLALFHGGWLMPMKPIHDRTVDTWIVKAANLGNTNALMFINGNEMEFVDKEDGVVDMFKGKFYRYFDLNYKISVYYFLRAARKGDYWAQKMVSGMYRFAEYLPQDFEEADKWSKRARTQEF
jgi:TPR repeat protein